MTEEVVSSLVLVAMTAGKHEEEDAMRKKRIANNMVQWLAGWVALDSRG